MDVVIPVAEEPRNRTLPLAVASIRKHTTHRVILAGHVEPWEELADLLIPVTQARSTPLTNTDTIMATVCTDPRVDDTFLWSNDDIFWRAPADDDELTQISATARGDLVEHPVGGRYARAATMTARQLQDRGLPTFDYERHVPMIVDAPTMLGVLAGFGRPFAKRSAYLNTILPQPAAVEPDVKIWQVKHPVPRGPVFSVGSSYPYPLLLKALGG